MVCKSKPIIDYILGTCLSVAGLCSYIPQYYTLIKSGQSEGISELSLFILNIGSACLTLNSIILNWFKFACYKECDFWLCTANLLSLWQISMGWIAIIPLYMIFIRFKIRNRLEATRHCIFDLAYVLTYALFLLVVMGVSLGEELSQSNSKTFFLVFSKVLGIASAISSCVVWIPQIIKLTVTKKSGSLSLLMFLVQAPGNVVIIVFQAIMFHQNWSTWISYVITFIEQLIIVIILIIYKCNPPRVQLELESLVVGSDDSFLSFSDEEVHWPDEFNFDLE